MGPTKNVTDSCDYVSAKYARDTSPVARRFLWALGFTCLWAFLRHFGLLTFGVRSHIKYLLV